MVGCSSTDFTLGWRKKGDWEEANLLSAGDLRRLFPDGEIHREKLFGLTKSLALETASKGITVNCVAPGFIETDMTEAVPAHLVDQIVEQIPCRRFGQPEEVARLVEFIVEPESGYITGQVYSVNGGLYM